MKVVEYFSGVICVRIWNRGYWLFLVDFLGGVLGVGLVRFDNREDDYDEKRFWVGVVLVLFRLRKGYMIEVVLRGDGVGRRCF